MRFAARWFIQSAFFPFYRFRHCIDSLTVLRVSCTEGVNIILISNRIIRGFVPSDRIASLAGAPYFRRIFHLNACASSEIRTRTDLSCGPRDFRTTIVFTTIHLIWRIHPSSLMKALKGWMFVVWTFSQPYWNLRSRYMRHMQLRPGFHWYKPYFNLGSSYKVSAHCLSMLHAICTFKQWLLEDRTLQSRNFLLFNVEISITPLQLIVLTIIIDNIGSGLAYQIYLVFRCTKASTSSITSHTNNTYA